MTAAGTSRAKATADAAALLSEAMAATMSKALPRADYVVSPEYPVTVDRPRARSGAWYEMVPHSQGRSADRGTTFDDCIDRLPYVEWE